jgi:hypothetical protein
MDSSMVTGEFEDSRPRKKSRSRKSGPRDGTLLEDAKRTLTESGCFVAVATERTHRPEGFTLELDGDFSAFGECARELGIRVVFLVATWLQEEDFYSDEIVESYDDDTGEPFEEDADDDASVDLRRIEPALTKFESHIDSIAYVTAIGYFGSNRILSNATAEWFSDFSALRDRACEKGSASASERYKRRKREGEERRNDTLRTIRALSSDPQFKQFISSGRPTLQSISAYVRENVEGARYLMQGDLRDEARKLKDKSLLRC